MTSPIAPDLPKQNLQELSRNGVLTPHGAEFGVPIQDDREFLFHYVASRMSGRKFDRLLSWLLRAAEQAYTGSAVADGDDKPSFRFNELETQIPAQGAKHPRPNTAVLVIDFGGTNLKLGMYLVDASGRRIYHNLSELPNTELMKEFDQPADQVSLEAVVIHFMRRSSKALQQALGSQGLTVSDIEGVGAVWSNAMTPIVLSANTHGVTGIGGKVIRKASGQSYRKQEPTLRSIKDGDRVDEMINRALKSPALGINFQHKVFAIGNDIGCVHRACPNDLNQLDGAVIFSTGANASMIKHGHILNLEAGAGLRLPPWLFSADGSASINPDIIEANTNAATMADVAAGRGLGMRFGRYIAYVGECWQKERNRLELGKAAAGLDNIQALGAILREDDRWMTEFQGPDLSLLLAQGGARSEAFIARRSKDLLPYLNAGTLDKLHTIACHLAIRGGNFAGMIAFVSACQIFEQKQSDEHKAVIGVDSRLADNMPIYWTEMQAQAKKLAFRHWNGRKEVALRLLVSENKDFSIAMDGMGRIVEGLLAGCGIMKNT